MNSNDLSIVILTKNGGELFAEVLKGLFACDGILESEILVIDSGSVDHTVERAMIYPQIRIHRIPATEFGHGSTRNLGARMTTRPVIVYLVQDATPTKPDFLTRLTMPLSTEGFAAVYGRQLPRPWTNKLEAMFLNSTYPDTREVRARVGQGPLGIRDIFFSNVCAALRRDVWEQIKFDETLIMSEDQLWAKQALLAGHRLLYEPDAAVFHSHNYGLPAVFKRNFDSGASLAGIAEDTFGAMWIYEVRHLVRCMSTLLREANVLWIPYLLAYEATRTVAFLMGQRAQLLPRWMNRKLSLHKYYWEEARTFPVPQPTAPVSSDDD
jgi:rhamnosyltransferase